MAVFFFDHLFFFFTDTNAIKFKILHFVFLLPEAHIIVWAPGEAPL